MQRQILIALGITAGAVLGGCSKSEPSTDPHAGETAEEHAAHASHEGHDHDDHAGHDDHGDRHELGTTTIGGLQATCWQVHGEAEPGKELFLMVKLDEATPGGSTLRAWIGTDDRLSALVSKGEFDADEGLYGVHAEAPDPLPEGAAWWIEVETPEGETQTGSIALH